jgi:hypothetical protein
MGQEGRAAKLLAQAGYAPHDVTAAYELLKAQDFWQFRHLSLQTVAKEIPAIQHALLKGARSKTHAGQGAHRYAASESEAKIGEKYIDANGQIHTRLDPELVRKFDEHRARLRAERERGDPGADPPTEPPAENIAPPGQVPPLQGAGPVQRTEWMGRGDLANEGVGEGYRSLAALREAPSAAGSRPETNDPASYRPAGQEASAHRGEVGWADAPPPDPKLQRRIDKYHALRKAEGTRHYL